MKKRAIKFSLVLLSVFMLSCDNFYVQEILRDGAFLNNIVITARNGAGEKAELNYSLNPGFTPENFTYYAFVPKDSEYITVTGLPERDVAVSYSMNGTVQDKGNFPFSSIDPVTEKNSTVTLTASRKFMDTRVYTVAVYRKQPTWVTGINVKTDVGGDYLFDLNPGFNSSILDYAVGVSHTAERFRIQALKRDFDAVPITLEYSGDGISDGVDEGDGYYSYDFPQDLTEKTVTIRASFPQEDPMPLEYTITVRRPEGVASSPGQEAYFVIGGSSDHLFQQGEAVAFRVDPPFGYTIQTVTGHTAGGAVNIIPASGNTIYEGNYTFIMPAEEVTLTGVWNAIPPSSDTNVRYVYEHGTGDGSSWANAAGDLQALIDAYNADETPGTDDDYEIWAARGTIHPVWAWVDNVTKPGWASAIENPGNKTKDNWCFVLKKGVKIYGGFRGTEETQEHKNDRDIEKYETVLSGAMEGFGNTRHLIVAAEIDEPTILDGFSVADSMAGGRADPITIAGVLFLGDGTAKSCWTGAGIFTSQCTRALEFSRLTIRDNSTMYGAGVYNHTSSPTFKNCTFKGNSAYSYGGAMMNYASSPLLDTCDISANMANSNGGGIHNTSVSFPVLRNTRVNGNWGGGIYGTNSGLDMTGGEILDNKASGVFYTGMTVANGGIFMTNVRVAGNNSAGNGGGIYAYGSTGILVLTNVEISGNRAVTNGGGLWTSVNNTTLTNITVASNRAGTSGGGIYISGSTGTRIRNTIVWGNGAGAVPSTTNTNSGIVLYASAAAPVYLNSLVQNADLTASGGLNGIAGNDEPVFASPLPAGQAPASGGDYGIYSGPTINAGDNTVYSTDIYGLDDTGTLETGPGPSTDPGGAVRPQGIIDLGAYEGSS